ncbi:uncharacterized protein [Argopecten irradians]|uniref:uncharacterized protein n=1 Tax=Argopecten irradians TaxID=31199 RepID=UPI003724C2E8
MASDVAFQKGQMPVREKGNAKCFIHKQKDVVLYCSECDCLICITCSITDHHGHSLVELLDITIQKKAVLSDCITSTENNILVRLKTELRSVENMLTQNESDFEDIDKHIKQQGADCKNIVDIIIQEFLSESGKFRDQNKKLLLKYKEELEQRFKILSDKLETVKHVLQSGSFVQVYDEASCVSDFVPKLPTDPVLYDVEFRPRELVIDQLKLILGQLSTTTSQSQVQLHFQHKSEVTSICPSPSGMWLSNSSSNEMQLVDFKGRIQQKIKHTSAISCCTLSPKTNCVWFSCEDDTSIYEVLAGTKYPVRRFTTDSSPLCICISKSEHVVVGSHNEITIYTTEGQKVVSTFVNIDQQGIEYVESGSISQCPVIDNYAVLRRYNSDDDAWFGNIILYDQELRFKFIYNGTGTDFPCSAVYDSRGNLVVSTSNNAVQLVTGTGQYVRTIHTEKKRITTIGLQSDDVLWISAVAEKKRMLFRGKKSDIKTVKYPYFRT